MSENVGHSPVYERFAALGEFAAENRYDNPQKVGGIEFNYYLEDSLTGEVEKDKWVQVTWPDNGRKIHFAVLPQGDFAAVIAVQTTADTHINLSETDNPFLVYPNRIIDQIQKENGITDFAEFAEIEEEVILHVIPNEDASRLSNVAVEWMEETLGSPDEPAPEFPIDINIGVSIK